MTAEQNITNTEAALEFLPIGDPIAYDTGTDGIEVVPELLMRLNNERYYAATIGMEFHHADYKHRGKPIRLVVAKFVDGRLVAHDMDEKPTRDGWPVRVFCFPLGLAVENIKVIKDGAE